MNLIKESLPKIPLKISLRKWSINNSIIYEEVYIYIYIFRSDSKSNSTSKFRNKEKQKFCTVKIIRQFVFTIRFWKINIQPSQIVQFCCNKLEAIGINTIGFNTKGFEVRFPGGVRADIRFRKLVNGFTLITRPK